jgi:flagellar FliL protein
MAEEREAAAPPPQAARMSKKRIAVFAAAGAVVLALAGAGVVALVGGGGAPEEDADAASHDRGQPSVVPLAPFVLNLADRDSDRFLRATVHIVLDRPDVAAAASADGLVNARLHDRILTLLSSKTADEIGTFTGKEELRAEVGLAVQPLIEGARVLEVYFSEFLVQ